MRVAQKVMPHILFLGHWYREGMHVLVSRWRKAVDVDGDYVEK
jgi:hypothetical protein